MKPTRAKIALAIVAALLLGVLVAFVHGNGSDATLYHEPGQRPARPG